MNAADPANLALRVALKRQDAMRQGQLGCSSVASFTDAGWTRTREVFDGFFAPLLAAATRVHLRGYRADWLAAVPPAHQPPWASTLQACLHRQGRDPLLVLTPALIEALYPFWCEPSWRAGALPGGGTEAAAGFVRAGRVVIEVDPMRVPVAGWLAAAEIFIGVGNPWAGGLESVGRWLRQSPRRDGAHVFFVHRNLACLRAFAGPQALGTLFDRLAAAGLAACIDDHVPSWWCRELCLQAGESQAQALARLAGRL